MGLYNSDGNNLGFGFGFNVSVGRALDSRVICDYVSDLTDFDKGVLYVGLLVYVISANEFYVCSNTNLTNSEPSEWIKVVGSDVTDRNGVLRIIGAVNEEPTKTTGHLLLSTKSQVISDEDYESLSLSEKQGYDPNIKDYVKLSTNTYEEPFDGMVVIQLSGSNKYLWVYYDGSFIIMTQRGEIFDEYWQGLIYAGL